MDERTVALNGLRAYRQRAQQIRQADKAAGKPMDRGQILMDDCHELIVAFEAALESGDVRRALDVLRELQVALCHDQGLLELAGVPRDPAGSVHLPTMLESHAEDLRRKDSEHADELRRRQADHDREVQMHRERADKATTMALKLAAEKVAAVPRG